MIFFLQSKCFYFEVKYSFSMATDYKKIDNLLLERLVVAHSKSAVIRTKFFEKEFGFFRKHIRDKNVFVAGSGLGQRCF